MKRVRSSSSEESIEYDCFCVLGNRDLVLQCICPFLSFSEMSMLFSVNRRLRMILRSEPNHPIHLIRREYEVDRFYDGERVGKALLSVQNIRLAQMVRHQFTPYLRVRKHLQEYCVSIGFIGGMKILGENDHYRIGCGIEIGIRNGKGTLMRHLVETEFKNVALNCPEYKNFVHACLDSGDYENYPFFYNRLMQCRNTCVDAFCVTPEPSGVIRWLLTDGKNIEKFSEILDLSILSADDQVRCVLSNTNIDSIRYILSKYDLRQYRKNIRATLKYQEHMVRRLLADTISNPSSGVSTNVLRYIDKIKYLKHILKKKGN